MKGRAAARPFLGGASEQAAAGIWGYNSRRGATVAKPAGKIFSELECSKRLLAIEN